MSVEPQTSRSVQIATLILVTLATLAVELGIAAPGSPPTTVLLAASGCLVAPMLLATAWITRRAGHQAVNRPDRPRVWELAALMGLLILPLAGQPVVAAWFGHGLPLEAVLMAALRNLGLGLATLAHRSLFARLAALVSLFLILIASALEDGPLVLGAVGLYAVAGVVWLMLAHWERLAPSLIKSQGRRSRRPLATMCVWAAVFAGLVVGAVAVGPSTAATVLAEWVSSSGGTGENDPDARSGVNDGDNEVAASHDPKSIGFTESELNLESDRPSLYDSFSDQYGEPPKPKGKQERMIAMAPQNTKMKDHATENLQAGRKFATVRQQPSQPTGRGTERAAKALIYIKGATPVHLGLVTYDEFDGVDWAEESPCGQHCPLELIPHSGAWLRLDQNPPSGASGGLVQHQIKVGTLDSSTLPIPTHVTRFRVGSVNRPEFFGWAQAGLLAMVARTVPAGTMIETESHPLDPRRLRSIVFEAASAPPPHSHYLNIPPTLDPGVKALVGSWADATPRGWSQVEAVVAGVRNHCLHDRQAATALVGDQTDVVSGFLLGSRCGPDHHFATATAVALRLLGYPSRVVSGYYAAPRRYDPRTHHTPVTSEDVHFWVEVLLPGGTWAAVEPTPGYEIPIPALTLGEQLVALAFQVGNWIRSEVWSLGLGLLGLVAVGISRHWWLDLAATLAWRLVPAESSRVRVRRTLRLLELRSNRAGLPRPTGRTPARWYQPIAASAPGEPRVALERLLTVAGWASHAPVQPDRRSAWSDSLIDQTCRQVVQSWTLSRFRAHRRSLLPEVTHS